VVGWDEYGCSIWILLVHGIILQKRKKKLELYEYKKSNNVTEGTTKRK
jgi:hypothetical protein